MELQSQVLHAIDLALVGQETQNKEAEQLAIECYKAALQRPYHIPSIIWGFVAMDMRDPTYLRSERKISALHHLRAGIGGPQYIFITLDEDLGKAIGSTGQEDITAAESVLSRLRAFQPPSIEQLNAAFEQHRTWREQQDPELIYIYLLRQVWSVVSKTDVFSLSQLGFYSSFGSHVIGMSGNKPSMADLLDWSNRAVEFLRGVRSMTLCWEYLEQDVHYYLI